MKVLVIADLMAIQEGVIAVLRATKGISLVVGCETLEKAQEVILLNQFNLVLIDLQFTINNGLLLGSQLLIINPALKIILFSKESDRVVAAEIYKQETLNISKQKDRTTNGVINLDVSQSTSNLFSVSLHGYILLRNITPDLLEKAFSTINSQSIYIDNELLVLLSERSKIHRLTPRETQCADLISQGKSNQEVALKLGITRQAVENLINSIYNKLLIKGEPKDPSRRVLLALLVQRWKGLN